MKRVIKFYRNSSDRCPTEEFLDTLSEKVLIKVLAVFKLVEELEVIPVRRNG